MTEDSRETIKILHTADLHLGISFRSLKGRDIEERRRSDFRNSLRYVVDKAIEEKVDLFLISGDVFHRINPNPDDFVFFGEQIGRMTKLGIKVVIIAGNHDKPKVRGKLHPLNALKKANAPNFDFFQSTPRKPLVLDVKGKKVGVFPLPYIDPSSLYNEEVKYDRFLNNRVRVMLESDEAKHLDYKILMAHLTLSRAKKKNISMLYYKDPSVNPDDILASEFDYVALGHIHENQNLRDNVWYSGSIERIDFSEADETKYFNIVKLGNGSIIVEKVEIPTKSMHNIPYEKLSNAIDPVGEVVEYLKSLNLELEDSLVKLRIRGNDAAVNSLKNAIVKLEKALLEELKISGYMLELKGEGISADLLKTSEINTKSIPEIVTDYIKSLEIEEDLKERALKFAKQIMLEVGGE